MKKYNQPAIDLLPISIEDLLLDLSKVEGGGPQLIPGQNLFQEEDEDKLPENPNLWNDK